MLPSVYWKELAIGYRSLWMASILFGLEKLIETEFKCPVGKIYVTYYAVSFLLYPGVLFSFITLYVLAPPWKKAGCKECCYSILEVLAPWLTWSTVLLIDGRYIECIYKNRNSTNDPSYAYSVSQVLHSAFYL